MAFSSSVFWLVHAVISDANPIDVTVSLYIHVESSKGMQFALKYEICELKRLQKLESTLPMCAYNSSIRAYKAVRGSCLSPCTTTYWSKY